MSPVVPVVAIAVAISLFQLRSRAATDAEMLAAALAPNLMAYHQAAANWVSAQPPGYSGSVPEASMTLPGWYRKGADWRAVADGAVVATFAVPSGGVDRAGHLAAALTDWSDGDYGAGVAAGGLLRSASAGTLLTVPPAVPDGAAVYVTRIQ